MANGFAKVDERFVTVAERFAALEKKMTDGFAAQAIKLDFIQTEIAGLRKDLAALSKRTKEVDQAFTKELLKLKNRVDALERQLKALKAQRA